MSERGLGVGASHNDGACPTRDGRAVVPIQGERLTRPKRATLFPAFDHLAISYCLQTADVSPAELAFGAVATASPVSAP
jgi:predicted NodU family carbamoyl transferase